MTEEELLEEYKKEFIKFHKLDETDLVEIRPIADKIEVKGWNGNQDFNFFFYRNDLKNKIEQLQGKQIAVWLTPQQIEKLKGGK